MAVLDYENWPAEDVVNSIRAAGFDSVEWSYAHVESLLQPASAIASHQDLATGGESAVDRTIKAIEKAAEVGIPIVNVVTGPNLWEDGASPVSDEEPAWNLVLTGLERICKAGASNGVKIGLEPCWGTLAHDAATTQRVLDTVPVNVNFDPSHFVLTGDPIPALIDRWADRIIHFHLKDAFGKPGREGEDFIFCLLGEGAVPWSQVFDALEAIGYSGALSVEFEAYRYYEQILASDPEAAARLSLEQVASLIEQWT